jgi:hypothetical protein
MANILALHSVGNSIVTYLRNSYPQQVGGIAMPACSFELISCSQLASNADDATRITLLLYRVNVNEHVRQTRAAARASDGPAPLPLDLHYMVTAWGATSLDEQLTFAWALRQLHEHPVLDASALSPEAGWARDEVVQIVPAELTTEDMMRVGRVRSVVSAVVDLWRLVRLDPTNRSSRVGWSRQLAFGEEGVPDAPFRRSSASNGGCSGPGVHRRGDRMPIAAPSTSSRLRRRRSSAIAAGSMWSAVMPRSPTTTMFHGAAALPAPERSARRHVARPHRLIRAQRSACRATRGRRMPGRQDRCSIR